MSQKININVGLFWHMLTVAFITLKLTGHITWPWIYVFAPLWGPILFAVFIFVILYPFLKRK